MKSFLHPLLIKRLNENPLSSLNILGFFQNYNPDKIVEINKSVMACGQSDELWWYIHCLHRDDFTQFLDSLTEGVHYFAVLSDWMMAEVESQFDVDWVLSCKRFYLPSNVILPKRNHTLTELTFEDTDKIFDHSNYKSYISPEYIKHQLKLRTGVAYRDGETLAGWAMFHDDGAMGLLHVLDKYRRQGIAREMVVELCRRMRQQNQIPFTSVEPSNSASLAMVSSLGFIELDNIHWCKVER
jgi:ribosomal protein S18 acetylase RimI-like enzyme